MINKFFLTIIFSLTLTHCGFSPIYTGNSKQVIISKSEIIGDKDLAFNLEQKLNFKKDEKSLSAYIFKAQIYPFIRPMCVLLSRMTWPYVSMARGVCVCVCACVSVVVCEAA